MPRGRPRKNPVVNEVVNEVPAVVETKSEAVTEVVESGVQEEAKKTEEVKIVEATKVLSDIEESRKALNWKLEPSQQFFESPEGYIVIGEVGRGRVWCRQANGGNGMWINPMR